MNLKMTDFYDRLVGPFENELNAIMDRYGVVGGANRNGVAHVLGSALISHDYHIAVADLAGWAKEALQAIVRGNDYNDFKVDVYNNDLGLQLSLEAKRNNLSRDELVSSVIDAYRSGRVANVDGPIPSLFGAVFSIKCFPASTLIALPGNATKPISDIRPGDEVLAFDPSAAGGRGALVPRRVTRLYENVS